MLRTVRRFITSPFTPSSPSSHSRTSSSSSSSPLLPLSLRTLACLLFLIGEILLLFSSPDTLQAESCSLQKGLQNFFAPGSSKTASTISPNSTESFLPSTSGTTAVLISSFLSSISERSATLFTSLMKILGVTSFDAVKESLPWGMYWAATIYRMTSWRTWLLASSMMAWAYDHDLGVNLFTYMSFAQIAQSLARNIIGSPPGYWLCSTGPQQLCHTEGYSLPPENLTLSLAFFFFLQFQLSQIYESLNLDESVLTLEEENKLSVRKTRARLFGILGIMIPILIAMTTIYYGTHSLLDNVVGLTFSLLIFSVYRLWDEAYLHVSASNIWGEGEEDGAKNPDLKIQLIEKEVERRAAGEERVQHSTSSITSEPELSTPLTFFSWPQIWKLITPRALFHLFGGIGLVGLVYLLEGLIRLWDSQALSQYPDSWKHNVERNCNLSPGAAPFLMSLHSLGFGFAQFGNTAALSGLFLALAIRDGLKLADSTTKHRPLHSLARLALGVLVSGFFSRALRWWLLEDQHQHQLGRKEAMDSLVMHLELFLRPLWVVAISPVVFHYLNLGTYLDDFERSEDFVILQEAEDKGYRRRMSIGIEPQEQPQVQKVSQPIPFPVSQSSGTSIRQRPSTRTVVAPSRIVVEETTVFTPNGTTTWRTEMTE